MALISSPQVSRFHADRFEECQRALEPAVRELMLTAEAAGWMPEEISAAIAAIADFQMLTLEAGDVIAQLRRHLAD